MNTSIKFSWIVVLGWVLSACTGGTPPGASVAEAPAEEAQERGPNNGIMLRDGEFAVELAIFETGVPPEYRAWITNVGEALSPGSVDLEVRLTRLGNVVDEIGFNVQGDYLRGDTVIYEPHSFSVSIDVSSGGRSHGWEYDSFEGRSQISSDMAAAFEFETMLAGPPTVSP
jgi:cobalt-zinc-cadmium efflux system membrane fusion protein